MTYRSLLIAVCLTGCALDTDNSPHAPANPQVHVYAPTRASETTLFRWSSASDSALWAEVIKFDSVLIVGVKAEGAARGFYNGQRLIQSADFLTALGKLKAADVHVLAADSLLPQIAVRVSSLEALKRLRGQPFIDFVEPGRVRILPMEGSACGNASPYNGSDYQLVSAPFNYGYDYAPLQYSKIRVDGAWAYSTGIGVKIGLTDTGLGSFSPDDEYAPARFTEGYSAGRQPFQGATTSPVISQCSHGVRSAGLIAAPRNGRSMVGVAYRSNLVSVTQDGDVLPAQFPARDAIRYAAQQGARVIAMPWAIVNDGMVPVWSDIIADEISYWVNHPTSDVVFVAAAGTSPWAWLPQNIVTFPAAMSSVLAVSAAEISAPTTRPSDAHYGPELDVVAFTNALTTPPHPAGATQQLTSLGGSSGATAIATGVAALVRARYPGWSNSQVRSRIIATSELACGGIDTWHQLINAEAAVGGQCVYMGRPLGATQITFDRVAYGDTRTSTIEEYCISVTGDGSFQVNWPNGLPGSAGSGPHCRRYTFARGTYSTTITATVRDIQSTAPERGYSVVVNVVDLDNNPGCPLCPRIKGRSIEIIEPKVKGRPGGSVAAIPPDER